MPISTEQVSYRKVVLRDARGREIIVTEQAGGVCRVTVPRPVEVRVEELEDLACAIRRCYGV